MKKILMLAFISLPAWALPFGNTCVEGKVVSFDKKNVTLVQAAGNKVQVKRENVLKHMPIKDQALVRVCNPLPEVKANSKPTL